MTLFRTVLENGVKIDLSVGKNKKKFFSFFPRGGAGMDLKIPAGILRGREWTSKFPREFYGGGNGLVRHFLLHVDSNFDRFSAFDGAAKRELRCLC